MEKIKDKNIENQTEFETFFITMFDARTSLNTSYLKLPTNNCISYCVKEIKHSIESEIEQDLKVDRSKKLIINFYQYILKDTIIKDIDQVLYAKLLLNLKNFSEGEKVSLLDKYAFFESIDKYSLINYRKKLFKCLLKCKDENLVDEKSYELIDLYINELLAMGYNYLYLNYVLKLYKEDKFANLTDFLNYIQYRNLDSFDIYIPIYNFYKRDLELLENQEQKIEVIDDNYYCKVYANDTADFYHVIKENMIRINSLFNILRFYSNSNIDYDRDKFIIVHSKYFKEDFNIEFSNIDRYIGNTPYYKNLSTTIESLEKLQVKDKQLNTKFSYKLLDALSYAEKDKDIMTVSSYVDNWIAIESLISLCGRKKGYDAVAFYVPKILSARIILNNATNTLATAYKNYRGNRMSVEKFIKLVCNDAFDYSKIINPFYNFELRRMAKYLSDSKKLQEEFERIERILEIDILRIYMLRNEYVHTSNLNAFNSMQFIKLKHLLPMCMDEFLRILNDRIDNMESEFGVFFDVFSVFLYKYNSRNESFIMLNENKKYYNGKVSINTTTGELNIDLDKYIFNVIKNNSNLFKVYKNSEEYNEQTSY